MPSDRIGNAGGGLRCSEGLWRASWRRSSSLWSVATSCCEAALSRPKPMDENLITGIDLYGQHCAICHGTAKGEASTSPTANGEYPPPPQLATDGASVLAPLSWDSQSFGRPAPRGECAGERKSGSQWTPRWSKLDSNSRSHPLTRSRSLGGSWCVWQRATGPTPPSAKPETPFVRVDELGGQFPGIPGAPSHGIRYAGC
jgi:hypothetical protein